MMEGQGEENEEDFTNNLFISLICGPRRDPTAHVVARGSWSALKRSNAASFSFDLLVQVRQAMQRSGSSFPRFESYEAALSSL
jgi:hypothetical protein